MAFNWDEIEIGNLDGVNNSRFFTRNHAKHEKLTDDFNGISLGNDEKENSSSEFNGVSTNDDKPDIIKNLNFNGNLCSQPFVFTKPLNKKDNSPKAYKYANIYENKKQVLREKIFEEEKKSRIFHSKSVPNFKVIHEQKNNVNIIQKKPLIQPKTPLVLKKSVEAAERRRKMIEEYRKNSQPPKFVAKNVVCFETRGVPKLTPLPPTSPKTPMVMRNSVKAQQKKKIMMDEYKKNHEPEKFTARDAHVLHMEPFLPKRDQIASTNVVPFNLHMENRLIERKRYDQNYKQIQEDLKKKKEETKKLADVELVKQLRKNTSFKARPNPFK